MVDFEKLRTKKKKDVPVDPVEIFRRLPKPPGINDLYTSQAQVLNEWFERRGERDVVVKLHTGGGKTLVGLLMAQSTINETREPVLYLAPTIQLVDQTLRKARAHGIPAVGYERGKPLNDDFVNGKAIMVATYKALFHGMSKFGVRGSGQPQSVGAIILDDAHVAFSVVRESFTLEVASKDNPTRYVELAGLFRRAFRETDQVGTFDDILAQRHNGILEVPYWAWHEQLDAVREQIKSEGDTYGLIWPLLRDHLHTCHALLSRKAFSITPVLPLVHLFPTFSDAPRRIYMSATIADDSEIIRTFDATPESTASALSSRSLAGVSERMILIPELMPFEFDVRDAIVKLLEWTTKLQRGAVILVPSNSSAARWEDVADFAKGSAQVQTAVDALHQQIASRPVIFANRYDGLDLAGDSCRLLVMDGIPAGTSDYELFRANALHGTGTITRMLAQRIEQGIGRGARGAGDYCVVLLFGADLAGWVAKDANFQFLTNATRAQIEMGSDVSAEVTTLKDLGQTVRRSLERDEKWTRYHAETLAELVDLDDGDSSRFSLAAAERKAANLWSDGYHDQAITRLDKLSSDHDLDRQTRGWMQQLAARIADQWGNHERAEDLQRQAYASNRNLLRPKVKPPYRPLEVPGAQAVAIVHRIGGYRVRRGFLQEFENSVSSLHKEASANQFEQALAELGAMLGFATERHDNHGEGPDVLWLLPSREGLVIEVKSRKDDKNAFSKGQHGQLLVAAEWFSKNYPGYECIRVSVHPTNLATTAATAEASHVLTYEKLGALISDARVLIRTLCESQLTLNQLHVECTRLLAESPLHADRIAAKYLERFESPA
jgi:replicative superfamily II helicase